MKGLGAWLLALATTVLVAYGRLRARWFKWRALPTVRDALAAGLPPAPEARLLSLRVPIGPLGVGETSADFVSIPTSLGILRGRPTNLFRIASTRILPPLLRDPAVLRPADWDTARRRHVADGGFRHPRPFERPPSPPVRLPQRLQSVVRPEHFGVAADLTSARGERLVPPSVPDLQLARFHAHPPGLPKLLPAAPLEVIDPLRFGLGDDARPAAEVVPAQTRRPLPMTRARASFHFRHVDAPWLERLVRDPYETLGEMTDDAVQGFFEPSSLERSSTTRPLVRPTDLDEWLQQCKEQFLIRRDIKMRAEMTEEEIGKQAMDAPLDLQSIFEFTGLEFEDYQPEPVEVLQMRLEHPPPDMAPPTENSDRQLRWLLSAIREHPPRLDGEPPLLSD